MAKSKGMGIATSVKSGNFRPTKQGAGMTEKGVKAFRRANPGSKLQTAVTEDNPTGKRAARRKSFCARSAGQMKQFPNFGESAFWAHPTGYDYTRCKLAGVWPERLEGWLDAWQPDAMREKWAKRKGR